MKTLNLKQMEAIEGGRVSQRNCAVIGAVMAVSVLAAIATSGASLLFWGGMGGAAILQGAGSDCF